MDVLDVFNESAGAFTMASLTNTVNHFDYKPNFLDSLNLFEEEGIATRNVIIEEDYGTLRLVPTAPYGGTSTVRALDSRKAQSFVVPHLPTAASITAEEIQNVRAYAQNMQPQHVLMNVENLRNRKLLQMRNDLEATMEYHRMGAIKGQVLDADGTSVITDLFTKFNVVQTFHEMLLNTTTTNIINQIRAAVRKSLVALGDQMVSGWIALCSDSFFDKITGHTKVEDKYLNWMGAANFSSEHRAYGTFDFGGVTWVNYRGAVGGVDFIPAGKAYLVPRGTRGLFLVKYAPSDYIDRVNQIPSPEGLPIEVRTEMKVMGKGLDMEAQSNPLFLCTKPAAIVYLHENTA